MLGARDLRAFCRPPMGVAVAFAGVSTYADGSAIYGLFDRPIGEQLGDRNTAGFMSAAPELRLPFDAFSPMPDDGDTLTVTDNGLATSYIAGSPGAEDDGAFAVYALQSTGISIQASAANGQSVASDVLDAVVATLGGSAESVFRCRFRPFGPKELPADNVLPDVTQTDYDNSTDLDRTFRFVIRHLAAAADEADKIADARYVRAARLLNADPTLGGLVRYLREVDGKPEMEQQELQMMALASMWECEFSTSRRDPSVPGF